MLSNGGQPLPEVIVLMAATPSQPAASAVLAGSVMSVMLGVILAHTGRLAFALIQPHTSCMHNSMQGPMSSSGDYVPGHGRKRVPVSGRPACGERRPQPRASSLRSGHNSQGTVMHENCGNFQCCL